VRGERPYLGGQRIDIWGIRCSNALYSDAVTERHVRTNKSGTAPHPEMGGYGTGPDDRGVRFCFEWVRDHIGPYQFPKHAKGR
jgi:hypothetical protein